MPIHADYQSMYRAMMEKYGEKKGKEVFYATMKKKGVDYTKPRPKGKELKISEKYGKIDLKEVKEEYFSKGFIATTHKDSVGDKILKETLERWEKDINNDSLHSGPVSIHHDREDFNLAGLGKIAKVEQLEDGEYGLWVETHHNKTHPEFADTVYQIDHDFITHYSIEYDTHEGATTHREREEDGWVRIIEPDTELLGYGLASPRTVVNENAVIDEAGYKELKSLKPEVKKMEEEKKKKPVEAKPKEEAKKEDIKPKDETAADEEQPEEQPEEAKKIDAKELKESILAEIKAELKEAVPKDKPLLKAKEKIEKKEVEMKEFTEFKEKVLGKEKASISAQWKLAARLHNKMIAEGKEGMLKRDTMSSSNTPFELKEGRIEFKQLTTDTNPAYSTDSYYTSATTYTQTPTEFNDIYGPVIVNQLSEATTTWNLIPKRDYSGYSSITFRAKDAENSTVAGTSSFQLHGSTPGFDGHTGRTKYMIPFVTSYAEVCVEDEEIELARSPGGIGDVYSLEVKDATESWMSNLNEYLLQGTTTVAENIPYGLQKTFLSSGTLYGRDVGVYTKMAVGGYDDMSTAPITLKKLRDMMDAVLKNGAQLQNLVFVANHTQVTKITTLMQAAQRTYPTTSRFGFTGMPEFDGVAIHREKDASTDDIFLLDLPSLFIGIKKAPTYVEFAKTSMHRKGIIWMMYNLGCVAPNHNYWIYNLQTT